MEIKKKKRNHNKLHVDDTSWESEENCMRLESCFVEHMKWNVKHEKNMSGEMRVKEEGYAPRLCG